MTPQTETAPGSVAWIELGTTDRGAAKDFYTKLLGWTVADYPMGPEEMYTIFRVGGSDTAGGYSLTKDMLEQGVPPHWLVYVKVSDADETAGKITAAGGTILMGPFDVPNVGRMVVFKDPTGAVISAFQTGNHRGLSVFGQLNAPCWIELNTSDPAAAKKFYSDVFGWQYNGEDGYNFIAYGPGREQTIGGVPAGRDLPPGVPPHWLLYFFSNDCSGVTTKAESLGGTVLMPATSIGEMGTISIVKDPQGATFAFYQSPAK